MDADVVHLAVALNAWIDNVASRFPWRARLLRLVSRSPFGVRCLMVAIARRGDR